MSSNKYRKILALSKIPQIFPMQLLKDFDIAVEPRLYIVALESKAKAGKGQKTRFQVKKNEHREVYTAVE
jgi:hypothetical protein